MEFKKKNSLNEVLENSELYVAVEANNNDVGNCPTNNTVAGCGCSN